MNCNFVEEHMLDLAAGNTASSEVTKHLNACSGCATRLNDFRSTMALLDEWQTPEPSPYFDTRLKARMREEAAAQPTGFMAWFRRPVLAGALAGLMAVGVIMLGLVDQGRLRLGTQAPQVSAVQDLQSLDNNEDMFATFDILDDGQQNETAPTTANF
jgi:anti-sigma factor RsiW